MITNLRSCGPIFEALLSTDHSTTWVMTVSGSANTLSTAPAVSSGRRVTTTTPSLSPAAASTGSSTARRVGPGPGSGVLLSAALCACAVLTCAGPRVGVQHQHEVAVRHGRLQPPQLGVVAGVCLEGGVPPRVVHLAPGYMEGWL